ncbi:MAG: response regulator [Candidatus Bathyarchaeota archaeon]|nr:MAG: response regulator [Candidatus Bathyarchaeota archaeon]
MAKPSVKSSSKAAADLTEKTPIQVLHVDNEAGFLKVSKQCLEMQGAFQVDTASSVEEAMKKLRKKTYDAVLCDYVMPEKSGLEFLKELRENGSSIQFVMFTVKGGVAIKALNLGADHYVNKIGNPETLYNQLAHSILDAVERKRGSLKK